MKEKTGLAKVRARSTAIAATVFLLPTILLIIVYMIYPIIDTFVISMYKWKRAFLPTAFSSALPTGRTSLLTGNSGLPLATTSL